MYFLLLISQTTREELLLLYQVHLIKNIYQRLRTKVEDLSRSQGE
uniref:Uncharacterized protein n=1 Tax=Anguilla anguilla TaxID=7936 RepID=A0A0E9WHL2_ANGAN